MPEKCSCTWAVPAQLQGYALNIRVSWPAHRRKSARFLRRGMVPFLYVPIFTSRMPFCTEFEYRMKNMEPLPSFHLATLRSVILGRSIELEQLVNRFLWHEGAGISFCIVSSPSRSYQVRSTPRLPTARTIKTIYTVMTKVEEKLGVLWTNLRVIALGLMPLEHGAEQIRLRVIKIHRKARKYPRTLCTSVCVTRGRAFYL